MKKFVVAMLSLSLCFFILNCGSDDDSEISLSRWAGTWNAMDQYLNASELNQAWSDGAGYVNTSLGRSDVTAANLKAVFAVMLKTDFKSCIIEGDTMKIYANLDATGSPTQTITYVYIGKTGSGAEAMYTFEGDVEGAYKYLMAYEPEPGSATAAEHFHFQYASKPEDLGINPMWMATVMKQGTTMNALAASLEEVIKELPWALLL